MKEANNSSEKIRVGKKRTRHLIVIKGYSQKKAAHILGFSENTISSWCNKHGWRAKVDIEGGRYDIMEDFFKVLEGKQPELIKPLKNHWYKYFKKLQQESGG